MAGKQSQEKAPVHLQGSGNPRTASKGAMKITTSTVALLRKIPNVVIIDAESQLGAEKCAGRDLLEQGRIDYHVPVMAGEPTPQVVLAATDPTVDTFDGAPGLKAGTFDPELINEGDKDLLARGSNCWYDYRQGSKTP